MARPSFPHVQRASDSNSSRHLPFAGSVRLTRWDERSGSVSGEFFTRADHHGSPFGITNRSQARARKKKEKEQKKQAEKLAIEDWG